MCLMRITLLIAILPSSVMIAQNGTLRALVIGNSSYSGDGFSGLGEVPKHDVNEVKNALRAVGFDRENIDDRLNLNLDEFRNAIEDFRGKVRENDTVVFYYSGHGFSMGTANYLVPTNFFFRDTKAEAASDSIALEYVTNRLSNGKNLIVILDACRTAAPLLKSIEDASVRNVHGLADLKFPGGLVAYSTSDGKASTAEGPDHMSLYSYELKEALLRHPSSLQDALNQAKSKTIAASSGQQIPAVYDALGGTVELYGHVDGRNVAPPSMAIYTSVTQSAQWTTQDNGTETGWDDAERYCSALTLNGKTGWRVPEYSELRELLRDDDRHRGQMPSAFHLSGNVVWTSDIFNSTRDRDYRLRWDAHKDQVVTEFSKLGRTLCVRKDIQIALDRVLEMAKANRLGGGRGVRKDGELAQWTAAVKLPDANNCVVWVRDEKPSNHGLYDASDHIYSCFFRWTAANKADIRSEVQEYIRAADASLDPNHDYYVTPDGVKIQLKERRDDIFDLSFFPNTLEP